MAQGKKISELTELSSVTDNDEFLFVDKEGSGANSGQGGSNVKIKFSDLKMAITDGMKGEPGMDAEKGQKGEVGDRGIDGGGAAYFDQSPTDGDSIFYMGSGNLGLGTDSPTEKLDVTGVIKSTGLSVQSTSSSINLITTRQDQYSYVVLKNTTSSKDAMLLGYHTAGDFSIARADGSYAKLRLWHDDSRMQLMSSTTLHDNGKVAIGGSPEDVPTAKLELVGTAITDNRDLSRERVLSLSKPHVAGVTYGSKANFFLSKYQGAETSGVLTQARTRLDIALAHSGDASEGNVSDMDGTVERDGGTRVMTLTSDGKVGIGTEPTKPLEVAQANGNEGLRLNYLPSQYPNWYNADLYHDGLGSLKIESWKGSATMAGNIILAGNGGNVGIGTNSPNYGKLVVSGQYDGSGSDGVGLEFNTNSQQSSIESFIRPGAGSGNNEGVVGTRPLHFNSSQFKFLGGNIESQGHLIIRNDMAENDSLGVMVIDSNTNKEWHMVHHSLDTTAGETQSELQFNYFNGTSFLPSVLRMKGDGNVCVTNRLGINTDNPSRHLTVSGDAVIGSALDLGGCYAKRAINISGAIPNGMNISVHGLMQLDGNLWREAMVTIQFVGKKGDMTDTTLFKKVINLQGLDQYTAYGSSLVDSYGGYNSNITVVSSTSSDVVFNVPLPAGVIGTFVVEVFGKFSPNITPISWSSPSTQMPEEGYTVIPEEASSVPTESNELQELKKLVTDLGAEVSSLKNQLKGIE